MQEKKLIHIGTFGKPQGLKGEIKLNILTSSLEVFKALREYFLNNQESILFFKSFRKVGKNTIASLEGCKDRDAALSFKGKKIFTYKSNLPSIKNDEYYILDLVGCNVINIENLLLGNVVDIKNFGAGDLIEIKNKDQKIFYIPMNKENLVDVNLSNKTITVNPIKGLFD